MGCYVVSEFQHVTSFMLITQTELFLGVFQSKDEVNLLFTIESFRNRKFKQR